MKPLVCVYCEGNDTKLAVLTKGKERIKVVRTISVTLEDTSTSELDAITDFGGDDFGNDIALNDIGNVSADSQKSSGDIAYVGGLTSDLPLSKSLFVPIISEPIVNYHIYDGIKEIDKNKLVDIIIKDIKTTKGITVDPHSIDCMDLNDKSVISAFIEKDIPCVNFINTLAEYHGKRYYKIPTIKTAELSLAYYVSKSTKFFPEDYSLIIYIGKEYSKLLFLEGQNLKHLGATLDIGTKNLHTYDVYFSKILLEMENGGIPKLDNIILCGEDRSENLILSFYGTFPEANVNELKFDKFDSSSLSEKEKINLSEFAIPIATAVEYFDEEEKKHSGINILHKSIQDTQKVLQFGWHAIVLVVLLFIATYLFTSNILNNSQKISELDKEIQVLTERQIRNQAIVAEINPLTEKISSFDVTQSILDSASVGTGVWGNMFDRISTFVERRRNFWLSRLETMSGNQVSVNGYSVSRSVLTEFADNNKASLLKSVMYEPLRDRNAFAYLLNFSIEDK